MTVIDHKGNLLLDDWPLLEADNLEAGLKDSCLGKNVVVLSPFHNRLPSDWVQLGNIGIALTSNFDLPHHIKWLQESPFLAIFFPSTEDGRCLSLAYLLRHRYNYRRPLRAIGSVTLDGIAFMRRCGFDSFALTNPPGDPQRMHEYLTPHQAVYQRVADDDALISAERSNACDD